ncbi:hypothetical protein EDWATA_00240 [Edwardsiella tarda ATCC 23685]|uniref:Uncharacterized protein n=1 Tax=Edwardsiella tarda ATCC 23685 TaxID=500638 RepID=D4F0L2_EDWTA|nr:hypothetical protein EDWATA_00240 [Edwardsiella tarda ATCC 23685]
MLTSYTDPLCIKIKFCCYSTLRPNASEPYLDFLLIFILINQMVTILMLFCSQAKGRRGG